MKSESSRPPAVYLRRARLLRRQILVAGVLTMIAAAFLAAALFASRGDTVSGLGDRASAATSSR